MYNIARTAAKNVQNWDKWKNNSKIQNLEFSDKWVFNFKKRAKFSRRKGTRVRKNFL